MKAVITILFALSAVVFSNCFTNSQPHFIHQAKPVESSVSSASLHPVAEGNLQHTVRIAGNSFSVSNTFQYSKKFIAFNSFLKCFNSSKAFSRIYFINGLSYFSSCPIYIVFRSLII
jgi:hypothetical protein